MNLEKLWKIVGTLPETSHVVGHYEGRHQLNSLTQKGQWNRKTAELLLPLRQNLKEGVKQINPLTKNRSRTQWLHAQKRICEADLFEINSVTFYFV